MDEHQIAALLYRYARAVDTKDWELYRSVFTDDAYIDYSSAGVIAGSRDEVAYWLSQGFAAIPMSMHYITNIETDIDGDTASVRAMFYNPMQLPGMAELSYCGGATTTNLSARPTGGAAVISVRRTCGSSTRRPALRNHTSEVVRRASDNGHGFDYGDQASTAGHRAPLCAVSPRPPTAHRPPRFRGHGYHAPCMTRRAPAHV